MLGKIRRVFARGRRDPADYPDSGSDVGPEKRHVQGLERGSPHTTRNQGGFVHGPSKMACTKASEIPRRASCPGLVPETLEVPQPSVGHPAPSEGGGSMSGTSRQDVQAIVDVAVEIALARVLPARVQEPPAVSADKAVIEKLELEIARLKALAGSGEPTPVRAGGKQDRSEVTPSTESGVGSLDTTSNDRQVSVQGDEDPGFPGEPGNPLTGRAGSGGNQVAPAVPVGARPDAGAGVADRSGGRTGSGVSARGSALSYASVTSPDSSGSVATESKPRSFCLEGGGQLDLQAWSASGSNWRARRKATMERLSVVPSREVRSRQPRGF